MWQYSSRELSVLLSQTFPTNGESRAIDIVGIDLLFLIDVRVVQVQTKSSTDQLAA